MMQTSSMEIMIKLQNIINIDSSNGACASVWLAGGSSGTCAMHAPTHRQLMARVLQTSARDFDTVSTN